MDKAGVSRLFQSLKKVRQRKEKIGAGFLLGILALMILGSLSGPASDNQTFSMIEPFKDYQIAAEETTEYIASAFTDVNARWNTEANGYDGDWGTAVTFNAGQFATADEYPSGYASGFDSGTSGSGAISQVDIVVRLEITGLDASDGWAITLDIGASTDNDLQALTTANYALNNLTFTDVTEPNGGGWSWAEVQAAQIHIDSEKVGGGDKGDVSIYEYAFKVTYEAGEPQAAPVNDQAPTLDNPHDTDNMYARLREYEVTAYVSDVNGFADIDYLEITFSDDGQGSTYCIFRYDEDTDTFTKEQDGYGTGYTLNTGSSSAIESGTTIEATFVFYVNWIMGDPDQMDAKVYVVDDEPESDTDWYEVNWDTETRLDMSVATFISDDDAGTVDRGDPDETFYVDGTLVYYQETTSPTGAIVDIWVHVVTGGYGTIVGPFFEDDLTAGAFSATCYADDEVGTETYRPRMVPEDEGGSGTCLYYAGEGNAPTDLYWADQIEVDYYEIVGSDDRINLDATVTIDVHIRYDGDQQDLTTGTITINGLTATHQGSGMWRFTDSESSVMMNTYDTMVSTGETLHGLTVSSQNGQSETVIWDQLVIDMQSDLETPDNGQQVNFTLTIIFDYDDTPCTTYQIVVNRSTVWWYSFTNGNKSLFFDTNTDVSYDYSTYQVKSESTHGITVFTSNTETVTWAVGGIDYEKDLFESVSAVDVRSTIFDAVRNLVESIGVVGILTTLRGREKDMFEAITIADTISKAVGINLTEAISAVDTIEASKAIAKNMFESITASDVRTTAADYVRNQTESISAIDAQSNAAAYVRDFVEAITAADTIEVFKAITKDMTETIGVVDSWSRSVGYSRDLTENILAVDVQTNAAAFARNLVESINVIDVRTFSVDFARNLVESINVVDIIDTVKGGAIIEKDLTEDITVVPVLDLEGGTPVSASLFYQLFFSLDMWGYLGPIALVIGGYVVVNKDKFLGVLWFVVECLFISQYLTLVEATPDYWWHIFILLIGGMLTISYAAWDRS